MEPEVKKDKVRRDLEPDGKQSDSDAMESHPDFQNEFEDMAEGFFRENDPGYHALIQRLKGGDADQEAT